MLEEISKLLNTSTTGGLAAFITAVTSVTALQLVKTYYSFLQKTRNKESIHEATQDDTALNSKISAIVEQSLETIKTEQNKSNDNTNNKIEIFINNPKQSFETLESNFKLLEKYYEEHLAEYKLMSRASIIAALVGFLTIIIGVFLAFSNYTTSGILTSCAGLVGEIAVLLFFNQNKILREQIVEYHKKLVSTQYIHNSIALTNLLEGEDKASEIKRIIRNQLYLANELHNAKSTHLIGAEV